MKKSMALAVLVLLVGAPLAAAQETTLFTGNLLNPDRNGPYTVTVTQQRDTEYGGRVFVTKVRTVGGRDAHFDITIDNGTGYPTSIDIYGYTQTPLEDSATLKHIISCSGSEFAQIATDPDEDPYPHSENLGIVALCAFNPNGIGETTNGFGYLHMRGNLRKLSEVLNDIERIVLTGTAGGAFNSDDNNLVFKGPFGTVLKPVFTDSLP
jgi:hypothetical protein